MKASLQIALFAHTRKQTGKAVFRIRAFQMHSVASLILAGSLIFLIILYVILIGPHSLMEQERFRLPETFLIQIILLQM
jgi:hypothetical protein